MATKNSRLLDLVEALRVGTANGTVKWRERQDAVFEDSTGYSFSTASSTIIVAPATNSIRSGIQGDKIRVLDKAGAIILEFVAEDGGFLTVGETNEQRRLKDELRRLIDEIGRTFSSREQVLDRIIDEVRRATG
jgi:hypothetical protein